MYQINLIKGWQKIESYKNYKNRLSILFVVLIIFFLLIYSFLLVNLYLKQRKLTVLKEEQLYDSRLQYPIDKVTQSIYSQKKLKEIKQIVLSYPEYYKIHNYLLKKILNQAEIEIIDYNINKTHNVDIELSAETIDAIFTLINSLQEDQVIENFEIMRIKDIKLVRDKDTDVQAYAVQLNLKFSQDFIDEQT